MGDTVIPVKAFIQNEEAALFYFRGALLPEHQRALDELFLHAEGLVAAMAMAEHLPRTEALLLAMLVGVTRDLLRLQQRVYELERRGGSETRPLCEDEKPCRDMNYPDGC